MASAALRPESLPSAGASSAPTAAAARAPTKIATSGSSSRRAERAREVLVEELLGRERDGEDAGHVGADRDEADMAEREHAGDADEQVEAEDDRHVDEPGGDVELRRGRHRVADERDEDDERREHREGWKLLDHRSLDARHPRALGEEPLRAA